MVPGIILISEHLEKNFEKCKKMAIFAQPNRDLVQPSGIIGNYFLLFH